MCGNCIPSNIETATALHNFSIWLSRRMKKDTIEIIYPKNEDEIDFSQKW